MNQQKVGALLKELRREKELTQEQFAEKLNVSGRTVSRWETGNNMPDISLLVEIAEFYNVSIPEIISGERKSEKMNTETKEVAMSLSDYAVKEKETLLKKIRIQSCFGVIALVIYFVIDTVGVTMSYSWLNALSNYCFALVFVTPVMTLLYTTGLLTKTDKRKSLSTLPKNTLLLLSIVVATVAAFLIKFVLSLLF